MIPPDKKKERKYHFYFQSSSLCWARSSFINTLFTYLCLVDYFMLMNQMSPFIILRVSLAFFRIFIHITVYFVQMLYEIKNL